MDTQSLEKSTEKPRRSSFDPIRSLHTLLIPIEGMEFASRFHLKWPNIADPGTEEERNAYHSRQAELYRGASVKKKISKSCGFSSRILEECASSIWGEAQITSAHVHIVSNRINIGRSATPPPALDSGRAACSSIPTTTHSFLEQTNSPLSISSIPASTGFPSSISCCSTLPFLLFPFYLLQGILWLLGIIFETLTWAWESIRKMLFNEPSAPAAVVNTFAALGAVVVGVKLFSYVRLLFSLFVLPGVSVSRRCSWVLSNADM